MHRGAARGLPAAPRAPLLYHIPVTDPNAQVSRGKLLASRVLTSVPVGVVIGLLTRQRPSHHGLVFDTTNPIFSHKLRAQLAWGIYESAETRMVKTYLREPRTVIELGSSLGIVSAHIANQMQAGGRLVCVEANPELQGALAQTLERHAAHLDVRQVHAAVTGMHGQPRLHLGRTTMASTIVHGDAGRSVEVKALSLTDLLRNNQVTGEYDLVCDIEGSEASLIFDETDALTHCRTAIFELHDTSFHGSTVTVSDMVSRLLSQHKFSLLARHGAVVAVTHNSQSFRPDLR